MSDFGWKNENENRPGVVWVGGGEEGGLESGAEADIVWLYHNSMQFNFFYHKDSTLG